MAYKKRWIIYNVIMAFMLYWLSNLILWYPWSISTTLGITLMLTLSPVIWIMGIINCLIYYDGQKWLRAAIINAVSFLLVSVIADFVFFGFIRGALTELYEPTTFYGYMFLVVLPFIVGFLGKSNIQKNKRVLESKNYLIISIFGILFMTIIGIIIQFNITI